MSAHSIVENGKEAEDEGDGKEGPTPSQRRSEGEQGGAEIGEEVSQSHAGTFSTREFNCQATPGEGRPPARPGTLMTMIPR